MNRRTQMRMRSLLRVSSVVLTGMFFVCSLSAFALAQSQAASGSIEGTITDSTGAVVPDAKVSARNKQTGLMREALSNAEGLYRLPLLLVGDYDLTIDKQGFATLKREGVKIEVGQKVALDIQLGAA